MKLKFILFFLLNSILFSCNNQYNELEDGVYAEINTSLWKNAHSIELQRNACNCC